MTSGVRVALNARPCLLEFGHAKTVVDLGLGRQRAHGVVDPPVDAVVGDLVARPQGVGIVGKGPRGDAVPAGAAIATKTIGGVKDFGRAEAAGVFLFVPVSERGCEFFSPSGICP
jgi:hypothetical protein